MSDTKIDWCDKSWNPIVGCSKCSPGCKNCYAERMAHRLKHICLATNDNPQYLGKTDDDGHWTGKIECCDWKLDEPLHWRKPRRIFVCSMSDLFHKKVPFEFVDKVFTLGIGFCPEHTFIILTKRIKRMLKYLQKFYKELAEFRGVPRIKPLKNVHLGVSVSNQSEADKKIPILLQIPAAVRWLSIEPILGPIDFKKVSIKKWWFPPMTEEQAFRNEHFAYKKIDWVVVGCESGPGCRPCKTEWVRSIFEQCKAAKVPIFVKQVNVHGKVIKMPQAWPQELPE